MLFMIGGWWGLAQLVDSKRQLRGASRGLDMVEEMDPLERMRRRYGLEDGGAGSGSSGPGRRGRGQTPQPEIPSLEQELEDIRRKVDIYNFDYKPVPRQAEDDE
ncbi:hypothetical protein GPECTOR_1g320 [Gonium pectorale]|uniref:Uncharacterized protein n=1 Tax=Gonium pectorale TaxID=33097 RepID=A0A150H2Z8_GONPE|nr:hypothetical protein GPECTOR_1g320 [Gonium pectorale]|eukprot:KXZ56362.1 hypothetical protein GPECTOR_1g320 [Gonium pectorale]